MKQTEVLFMPTDGLIDSSISIVTDLSKELKIPVVSGSVNLVKKVSCLLMVQTMRSWGVRQLVKP